MKGMVAMVCVGAVRAHEERHALSGLICRDACSWIDGPTPNGPRISANDNSIDNTDTSHFSSSSDKGSPSS